MYRLFTVLLLLVNPFLAFADSENEILIDGAKIEVSESSANDTASFNFTLNNPKNKVTAIIVDAPTRLVFDIEGLNSKGGKNLAISSDLFKKVRVGAHKDKTRVVFDCASNGISNVTDLSSGDKISFQISSSLNGRSGKSKSELSTKPTNKEVTNSEDSESGDTNETVATPTVPPTLPPTIAPTAPPLKGISKDFSSANSESSRA